jgi:hypothetical protein
MESTALVAPQCRRDRRDPILEQGDKLRLPVRDRSPTDFLTAPTGFQGRPPPPSSLGYDFQFPLSYLPSEHRNIYKCLIRGALLGHNSIPAGAFRRFPGQTVAGSARLPSPLPGSCFFPGLAAPPPHA